MGSSRNPEPPRPRKKSSAPPPRRGESPGPDGLANGKLIYSRAEEPSPECPVAYREQAFAVEPGTKRKQVEALLKATFDAFVRERSPDAPRTYLQVAVFDHVFEQKPAGPPLATLAFKDWRGEGPVINHYGPNASQRPTSMPPPPPKEDRDLISELFEIVHELAFLEDVAAGADFVRGLLETTLQSPVGLIHAFDLNTKEFVVVSEWGFTEAVLRHRTSDKDPNVRAVMVSPRAVRASDTSSNPYYQQGRFAALPHPPKAVAGCRVQIGGRYLGLIELVTLSGQAPPSDEQVNALEYISEQLAEFFQNRPIVFE